jgi:excisionase family DNA binding protein
MNRPHLNGDAKYVSTAQVAKALGVSVTTVKRWVDDKILPAHRTAGGHRKLLLTDVVRLAREGDLPDANLSRLDRALAERSAADPQQLVESLVEALRHGNGPAVRGIIQGAYHAGTTIDTMADEVISPALAKIGHEWESGTIDVMHEHRGTQLIAAAVFELKAVIDRHAHRERPRAVGGAIEGDHYMLPSLLAQMALLDCGWDAVNVGPNTPFASFEKAIDELRPSLMWISMSYIADLDRFEREYRSFFEKAKAAKIAVAIGGRALPDDVRMRIPYTAYGDGLQHLVAFARTLHPQPRRPKRGRPVGSKTST